MSTQLLNEDVFSIDDLVVLGPSAAKKPGKGKGQSGPGKPGGPGQPGEPGDGEPDESLDKHVGADPNEETDTPTEEELEKHGKKARDQLKKRDEGAKKDPAAESKPQPKADRGGPGSREQLEKHAVDWTQIRPRFDWKTLLAKLIRAADTLEVTYQKVHRRNITSVHVATQTGAGVIRPGEKEVPANLVKLCIVIDSSGSMHDAIKKVFANIHKLFSENQSAISKQFALVEFSGSHHIYSCTLSGKTGSAMQISGVEGMKGGGTGERVDLSVLLGRHEGGGTNFDESLVDKLKGFVSQKYNVLILTDTDIVSGSNRENFLNLYAHAHAQVYLLLDSKESFTHVVQSMKMASANISHL